MKKNEKELDIDKTKPNLNLNKDTKDSKLAESNLNKDVGGNENKSDHKEKDRKATNPSNIVTKPPSSPERKEMTLQKVPNSPKLEKMSEDNLRRGLFSHTQDIKKENIQNNNLTKLPFRKFQLDISEMIEKPQDKLFPKK
jgi:hypothetical protein